MTSAVRMDFVYYLTRRDPQCCGILLGLKSRAPDADKRGMEDRRTEARMLCADVVHVHWREGTHGRSATALLEDISPSGACLQLESAVPLGVSITWETDGHEFTGKARYCVYREIGYFVGVEFEPGVKWSQSAFEPRHLLDLKKLIE